MIKKSKMRYARKFTPEERRLSKFAQSSDSCEDKPSIERGDPSGGEEEKPAEPAKAPKKRGDKGKKRREKCGKEANQAHTQMCNKAMRMMDKINSLLDKFEDTDSV